VPGGVVRLEALDEPGRWLRILLAYRDDPSFFSAWEGRRTSRELAAQPHSNLSGNPPVRMFAHSPGGPCAGADF
jgi:hypothetical protein